ncbi:MAG: hypothetical protein WD768_02265 [Phycisphaeraceae bacterium]
MKSKLSEEHVRETLEMLKIGNRAVHKAQEENRRLGLPNVYSHNGKLYYELPDGTITTESPFKDEKMDGKNDEKKDDSK